MIVVFSPSVCNTEQIEHYLQIPRERDASIFGCDARILPASTRGFHDIINILLSNNSGVLVLNYLVTSQGRLDVNFPSTKDITRSNLQLVITLNRKRIFAEFRAEARQTWDDLIPKTRKSFQVASHVIGRKIHTFCTERGISLVQERKHSVRYDLRENRFEFEAEGREITKCELQFIEEVPMYDAFMEPLIKHHEALGLVPPYEEGSPGMLIYENVFEERELKWLESRLQKKLLKTHPHVTHFQKSVIDKSKSAEKVLQLVQSHLVKCQLIEAGCIDSYDLLKIDSDDPSSIPANLPNASLYSGLIIAVQLYDSCRWYSHEPQLSQSAMFSAHIPRGSVCIIFPNTYASTLHHRPCGLGQTFCQVILRKKRV